MLDDRTFGWHTAVLTVAVAQLLILAGALAGANAKRAANPVLAVLQVVVMPEPRGAFYCGPDQASLYCSNPPCAPSLVLPSSGCDVRRSCAALATSAFCSPSSIRAQPLRVSRSIGR